MSRNIFGRTTPTTCFLQRSTSCPTTCLTYGNQTWPITSSSNLQRCWTTGMLPRQTIFNRGLYWSASASTHKMGNSHTKLKLVIDCDPGAGVLLNAFSPEVLVLDDTIALMSAFGSKRFDVLGVSTVYGNASVEETTDNALRVLQALGQTQVPVYVGASGPWTKKTLTFAPYVHGNGGLGEVILPEAKRKPEEKSAASFIVDVCNAHPGKVCFLFCGRLTNLADAIRSDPSLPSKWHRVAVMGGVFNQNGNSTIHSEANIFGDALAADYVFQHVRDVMVVGLDATTKCPLSSSDIATIAKHSRLPAIEQIYAAILKFYAKERAWIGGAPPHDAIALMALIHSEVFRWKKGGIEVITKGDQEGQTKLTTNDRPINYVAMDVDANRVLQYIKDYVMLPGRTRML